MTDTDFGNSFSAILNWMMVNYCIGEFHSALPPPKPQAPEVEEEIRAKAARAGKPPR